MLKRCMLDQAELTERIERSAGRLREAYYQMPDVFQPYGADWPGDKEGRALLAFVSHYKMTGEKNPCMQALLEALPAHTNEHLFFDPPQNPVIHEQQLSGHSWLLRGLCEHYEQFGDEFSLKALTSVTEHLYLPTAGRYVGYPVERDKAWLNEGGVSGHSATELNGWKLSTDVGCAFMSIDGLSHVYKITRDARVLSLLDEMIEVYAAIDKVALRAQTHCTLTAARGMLRLYGVTGNDRYVSHAKSIYELYVHGGGMDATYQNLNWWGRPNTWTEPCAIVDSLMVAGELYLITGEEAYRRMAARIYHNGLATAQRPNGGAGTDTVVHRGYMGGTLSETPSDTPSETLSETLGYPDVLDQYLLSYEAPFCCTMRLCEGLWYIQSHADILWYEIDEDASGRLIATRDADGRYMSGDLLLGEPSLDSAVAASAGLAGWKLPGGAIEADGHHLLPLIKYYKTPDAVVAALRQKILF